MISATQQYKLWKVAFFTVAATIFIITRLQAQAPSFLPKTNVQIDTNINGFWEYLPRNYSTDVNAKYPLLVFVHGYGDSGDVPDEKTLSRLLNSGLPKLIQKGGFPETFTVGGESFRFIVLCPQIKNGLVDESSTVAPSTIEALLSYAKSNYRVDQSRIYMCGLSMGGGVTWDYAASSKAAATQLAAIAVAAGASDLNTTGANTIAAAKLPIVATHNTVDDVIYSSRTVNNINKIKSYTPAINPSPIAIYWNSPGESDQTEDNHNVWSRTFEDIQPHGSKGGNLADSIGKNVYEWMLTYKRDLSALPVVWNKFSLQKVNDAVLVQWITAAEVNVTDFIVEKSQDGMNWTAIATVHPAAGNTAKTYNFTDNAPFPGVCYYRIRVLNAAGGYTTSAVQQINTTNNAGIKIFPNPFNQQIVVSLSHTAITGSVVVRLITAAGAVVRERHEVVTAGSTDIVLKDLQSLGNGIYYVVIANDKGAILHRKKIIRH